MILVKLMIAKSDKTGTRNAIGNRNNWSKCIKNIVDNLGYSHVYINNVQDNTNYFPLFKIRNRDQFIQEWNNTIRNIPKLEYYCKFKENFCFESYLDKSKNELIRKSFSRLRLSSHSLCINLFNELQNSI